MAGGIVFRVPPNLPPTAGSAPTLQRPLHARSQLHTPHPSASQQAAFWKIQKLDADPDPLQSSRTFDFRVKVPLSVMEQLSIRQ